MKKKFVLTLALVLMVAVTLSAATPVEVSGVFDFGYKMSFKDGMKVDLADGSNYSTFVAVSSDYWKVSLGAAASIDLGGIDPDTGDTIPPSIVVSPVIADESDAFTAKADIYLSKALADEGVDMGDVSLTLHIAKGPGAPSVFADAADYDGDDLIDLPAASETTLGLTIGYADLVKVYVDTDPTTDFDAMIGASFAPVDGVEAAVAYAIEAKKVAVSAAADIAALADLDFDLAASVLYVGDFGAKKNDIFADVAGELEGVGLYVGFSAIDLEKYGVRAGASYGTEVEGVKLAANVDFAMDDFDDTDAYSVDFGASAAYEMGTVTYKLAIGYALNGPFSLTPSVSFAW